MMQIVDCRAAPPEHQRDQVLASCLTLGPGGRMLLHAGRDPRDLLRRLADRYPGAFTWETLDTGAQGWLGIVSRRQVVVPRADGVHELMAREHAAVHAAVGLLAAGCAAEDWAEVGRLCAELRAELTTHFTREEQLLFPAVVAQLRTQRRLIAALQAEHAESFYTIRAITRLIGEMGHIEAPSSMIKRGVESLERLLRDHSRMEDSFLYMAVDHLLEDGERAALTRRLSRAG